MRWWVTGSWPICLFCAARSVLGQSITIDQKAVAPSAPAPPTPPPAPVRAEPIVPPRALATPVDYPPDGQGEQEVLLELTIAKTGAVTRAVAIQGDAPFTARAIDATKTWRFLPATRGDTAVAAKIRFRVRFVPPVDEPQPSPTEPGRAVPASGPPMPAAAPKEPAEYEVIVRGERAPIRHSLGRAEIREMPGAFGDPYRAIEALPGVVPIVSGIPYFYVRGAPPGNVGYFFDGIPVPYLYHFAAGPGVLHPAFVDRVDLYPGAYPARYGRFAGAIVAGEMAPPDYRFRGEASVRLIDSGAMLEAPWANGRGSVMLGGRYSYTGLVLSLIVPEVTLDYWDYQTRARYQLDGDDSLELLAFGAGDFLSNQETDYVFDTPADPTQPPTVRRVERENTLVDVGFHRLELRWDHRLEDGNWRQAILLGLDRTIAGDGMVTVTNRLVGARSEFRQQLGSSLELRAGADLLFEHLAQKVDSDDTSDAGSVPRTAPGAPDAPATTESEPPPGVVAASSDTQNSGPDFGFDRSRNDFTTGIWADLVLDAAPGVEVTPGLRLDLYGSGTRLKLGVDPRISARYALTRKLVVVHGLALVHQAPSFVVPIPGLKPSLEGGLQSAIQHSVGLSYPLPGDLQASLAVFQQAFFNLTDLISLVRLENTAGGEITDLRATGHAYGAELMVRRSLDRRLGGFVAYTLSRSVRSARNLEGPATTDRTHVLNLALAYHLGRNWRLGGRWLLYSGIPAQVAYLEAAQRPPRTPPFWRLDVKLQKRWYIKLPTAWWGLTLEVLNTTLNKEVLNGSCNAYTCTYDEMGPVTVPSIGAEGAF